MSPIITAWGASLSFLYPRKFVSLAIEVFWCYVRALWLGKFYFLAIVALDGVVLYAIKDSVGLLFSTHVMENPSVLYATLALVFLWLCASLTFITCLHKLEAHTSSLSVAKGVMRCLQWIAMSELFFLAFKVLLMDCGITVFPPIHWAAASAGTLAMQTGLFFWLDSRFSLSGIPRIFEKMVNIIFYNMPFMIALYLFSLGIRYGIRCMLCHATGHSEVNMLYSSWFGQQMFDSSSAIKFMLLKYAVFCVATIPIAVLFVIYNAKKHKTYAKPFF